MAQSLEIWWYLSEQSPAQADHQYTGKMRVRSLCESSFGEIPTSGPIGKLYADEEKESEVKFCDKRRSCRCNNTVIELKSTKSSSL